MNFHFIHSLFIKRHFTVSVNCILCRGVNALADALKPLENTTTLTLLAKIIMSISGLQTHSTYFLFLFRSNQVNNSFQDSPLQRGKERSYIHIGYNSYPENFHNSKDGHKKPEIKFS